MLKVKRVSLELVRLGQGSVRHVCLPPDELLSGLSDGPHWDPDVKAVALQHRTLCGRYGVPNVESFEAPTALGRRLVDPAYFRVCSVCLSSLEEVKGLAGALVRRAERRRRKTADG